MPWRCHFLMAAFDGAYSMNVSMNIADKAALYREIHRVLKPRTRLLLSEIAKGPDGDPDYPTPWAASASTSFLSTPEETRTDSSPPVSISFTSTARSKKLWRMAPARARWSSVAKSRRIARSS